MDLLILLIFFITFAYYEILNLETNEMLKETFLLITLIFIKF